MKSKLVIFTFGLLLSMIGYSDSLFSADPPNKTNYLKKPTGQYGVGFENFHWVNQNACPDVNFNGKNQADFSPGNAKHCHEIVARIYYPTKTQHQPGSSYYPPFIKSVQQDILKQLPAISKSELEQLTKIKSFSLEKAVIIKGKQFPVLLFSPGFGCPAEEYENFITELVSQGYIVVGISTPFINLVALPDGHVVKSSDLSKVTDPSKAVEEIFVPLQTQDVVYVYNKLQEIHTENSFFSSMDLKHIGAFGHSIGAWTLSNVAYTHPSWFKAIVPLDIGDFKGHSMKLLSIPAMYQISSMNQLISSHLPVIFKLGQNGYLIGISPNEQSLGYSKHMNFSDSSTLQYQPAYTAYMNNSKKQQLNTTFDFKLMSHSPTKKDTMGFHKMMTYVLFKQENTWHLLAHVNIPNQVDLTGYFDINRINGLPKALSALPNKPVESLSDSEIAPIRKIVASLIDLMAGALGTGNGWEITDSINTYLVQFFNTYLKGQENPAFKKCSPLNKDTYMRCGPGEA